MNPCLLSLSRSHLLYRPVLCLLNEIERLAFQQADARLLATPYYVEALSSAASLLPSFLIVSRHNANVHIQGCDTCARAQNDYGLFIHSYDNTRKLGKSLF
jgi:hypothetical protein